MGDAPLWRAHERISVQRASPWAVSIQFDNEGNVLNEALKDYKWDDSVKALVSSPQILERMDSQLEWMQQLGEAFLAQQKDTMDAVQRVRAKAQQPAQSYWYYCSSARAYYPTVPTCPEPWIKIPPRAQ